MRRRKNIAFWITTICLAAVIILIAGAKLTGIELRAVATGSMTPDIPVGSLVVIVPTKAEDIKVGNDITFLTQGDITVTHRVVEIDREKNEFTTWGIANDLSAIDAPSKYENILGIVRLHIPFAGRAFVWLSGLHGKIIMITAIISLYLVYSIVNVFRKKSYEKTV